MEADFLKTTIGLFLQEVVLDSPRPDFHVNSWRIGNVSSGGRNTVFSFDDSTKVLRIPKYLFYLDVQLEEYSSSFVDEDGNVLYRADDVNLKLTGLLGQPLLDLVVPLFCDLFDGITNTLLSFIEDGSADRTILNRVFAPLCL